jgi:hypothetical protein
MNPTPRYCKGCDYDLSAAAESRCPECGRAFAPDDKRTYRAFSRRSWRGRWRRWRWVVLALVLIGTVWPRGWVLTRMAWIDRSGAGRVETSALAIGHPWWLKGWFTPITWSNVTGGEWATIDSNTGVSIVDDLRMSDGAALWTSRYIGTGQLGVIGPAPGRRLNGAEWEKLITDYVRRTAIESATSSAVDQRMSISAPVPPWAELPTAPLR